MFRAFVLAAVVASLGCGTRTLGWTPGRTPTLEAPRIAWRLEPQRLVIQLHMIPSGKAEVVRLS
jgi:hypothetical protein